MEELLNKVRLFHTIAGMDLLNYWSHILGTIYRDCEKMKPKLLFIFLILSFINSSCRTGGENSQNKNTFISKVKYKSNSSEIDTLWVSQNDTTAFKREDVIITRPCSNPESAVRYDLINPVDSAYYFIYNDKQQLILEGRYSYVYTYPDAATKTGNFYNSKNYYYRKNGNLDLIHYMKDGRNYKSEHFDRKRRLTKIRYFDLKSSDIKKIEIYKKGLLKETRIYTSFDRYYTVKAGL
ncbi:hypothetical protein MQE36_05720 [Zhouia spongiae]|uniref:Uncharacterized protein n=1 Tax=Zhouia spongiae TaxID=2202721 RepID=A0ABY3YT04_9FLAO|nr:hypothetical protein [Zhouia spongiae]UNY99843.1 hypothetical protein MQE36_05720 [Zhouia spongiae]